MKKHRPKKSKSLWLGNFARDSAAALAILEKLPLKRANSENSASANAERAENFELAAQATDEINSVLPSAVSGHRWSPEEMLELQRKAAAARSNWDEYRKM